MTATAKSFGAFLISRAGIAVLRNAGYYAIGAGMLVAGIVGLRDFAPETGALRTLVQSSPLIATAAGAVWDIRGCYLTSKAKSLTCFTPSEV